MCCCCWLKFRCNCVDYSTFIYLCIYMFLLLLVGFGGWVEFSLRLCIYKETIYISVFVSVFVLIDSEQWAKSEKLTWKNVKRKTAKAAKTKHSWSSGRRLEESICCLTTHILRVRVLLYGLYVCAFSASNNFVSNRRKQILWRCCCCCCCYCLWRERKNEQEKLLKIKATQKKKTNYY